MPSTEKSPEFYKHYPALFHTYFPIVSAETLRLLCKAGYTYYNAVLCLDALVDEGDTKALVEMLALQEETIKILTSIYGYKSSFGNYGNSAKWSILRLYKPKNACLLPLRYRLNNTVA